MQMKGRALSPVIYMDLRALQHAKLIQPLSFPQYRDERNPFLRGNRSGQQVCSQSGINWQGGPAPAAISKGPWLEPLEWASGRPSSGSQLQKPSVLVSLCQKPGFRPQPQ